MSDNRKAKRIADKSFAYLGDLLAHFYRFLAKQPQPTDDEVRAEFIRCRTLWSNFSVKHGLSEKTRQEFTRQVSLVWHREENTTENETQQ